MQHFCYKTPLPRDKDSAPFRHRFVVIYAPLPHVAQSPHRRVRVRGAEYTHNPVSAYTNYKHLCAPRGLAGPSALQGSARQGLRHGLQGTTGRLRDLLRPRADIVGAAQQGRG